VRGGGDHVRMAHRCRVYPGRDQSGVMGHIHHQHGTDLVGDGTHAREIDLPLVGRGATDDHLRLMFPGQAFHGVVIEAIIGLAYAVGHDLVQPAGEVHRTAMGQMSAVRQIHAHDYIARLQQRHVHRHVRLRARVRLYIGVLNPEQLTRTLLRQAFDLIDMFAAAVVAAARITLGILVGQHRALGLEHRFRYDVLAGDQFQRVLLAAQLGLDGLEYRRIAQRCVEEIGSV